MLIPIIWGNRRGITPISIHSIDECRTCSNTVPIIKVHKIKKSHIFFITISEKVELEYLLCPICDESYVSDGATLYEKPILFLETLNIFKEIYFNTYSEESKNGLLINSIVKKVSILVELEKIFRSRLKKELNNHPIKFMLLDGENQIKFDIYQDMLLCAEGELRKILKQSFNETKGKM